MKTLNIRRFATICFILGAIIILVGCSPSVRDVTKVLYGVSIGVNRDDVRKALIEAFRKKYPDDDNNYFLVYSPKPVTKQILNADKKLISDFKMGHLYVRVYPADLFDKMPSGALVEPMGIVAEASEGNGSVNVFYDSNMNYIGFLSFVNGNDSNK